MKRRAASWLFAVASLYVAVVAVPSALAAETTTVEVPLIIETFLDVNIVNTEFDLGTVSAAQLVAVEEFPRTSSSFVELASNVPSLLTVPKSVTLTKTPPGPPGGPEIEVGATVQLSTPASGAGTMLSDTATHHRATFPAGTHLTGALVTVSTDEGFTTAQEAGIYVGEIEVTLVIQSP